jgi:hypothetical protein
MCKVSINVIPPSLGIGGIKNYSCLSFCSSVYHICFVLNCLRYCISGVMISMLPSSLVDRGFEHRSRQPKIMKLVFVAFTLSTQHYGERAETGLLGIRIMYPS